MIITKWKGYEIDSSEGYYQFEEQDIDVDEGYDIIKRLFAVPEIFNKVGFRLIAKDPHKEKLEKIINEKLSDGTIEKLEHKDGHTKYEPSKDDDYDYFKNQRDGMRLFLDSQIVPLYKIDTKLFLELIENMKGELELISFIFAVAPLKSLAPEVYENFYSWYVEKFKIIGHGKTQWKYYCECEEKDIDLTSMNEITYAGGPIDFFTGGFEMVDSYRSAYAFHFPSGDPSGIIHLVEQVLDHFDIWFCGRGSMGQAPDEIQSKYG
jgi:hypothetical protein